MTLMIQRSAAEGFVVFTLSGRIQMEHLAHLEELFEGEARDHSVVLDLKEVRLVEREAVTFLTRCEADGIKLDNCPAYIREWIEKERVRSRPSWR
jgi:hypothetical protein